MNSTEEGCFGCTTPAAMSAAFSAFHFSTQALKLETSSAFEIEWGGV
jgi:hypothetical protein